MASKTVTMKNPDNGDVRVVPVELEKKYADRGWKKQTAPASQPSSGSSSSADKK